MFLGSILKAKFDEGDYEVVVQRCLKVMLAGMANITKTISTNEIEETIFDVLFTSVLPDNLVETIEMLSTAKTGGIISKKTAVENNPLVHDVESEMKQINAEATLDALEPTQ